ncbi:MAG: DUF4102 domain-containing protein, partial [Synergistaceae bacterium]|nr:DUF4102 domain-containing protein [Synergistaceae bacterium]
MGCKVGRGLIVEIRPNGQKYFIVRAFKDGKEKRKHLGVYPEISLREARIKAVEARRDIFNAQSDTTQKDINFGDILQMNSVLLVIKNTGDTIRKTFTIAIYSVRRRISDSR